MVIPIINKRSVCPVSFPSENKNEAMVKPTNKIQVIIFEVFINC
jgi:hypothetical protein